VACDDHPLVGGEALSVLAKSPAPSVVDPLKALLDLVRHVQKRAADNALDPVATKAIVQRLRRLTTDLRKFLRTSPTKHKQQVAG
jgi:hypothetical protein